MSNPGKTSAYAPDRSYDSNDALESRFAPRNPQRFPGFRFAEVLLIGGTLDSGPWILESGAAGRRQMAAATRYLVSVSLANFRLKLCQNVTILRDGFVIPKG